jgi:hypothetical protein
MRRFLLISNAVVALGFAAFFAYTFLGRSHIDGMARTFVTAKTLKFATPVVELAAQALQSDLAQRLLTNGQRDALSAEIAEFRSQPGLCIQRLTSAKSLEKPPVVAAKISGKFHEWKERIRAHFNNVLGRLFTDLRIFSGSNVIAACIAFLWALRSERETTIWLRLCSLLLLLSTAFAAYLYIDSLSFFTILFNCYLGWTYPAILVFFFAWMFFDSGIHLPEERPPVSKVAR